MGNIPMAVGDVRIAIRCVATAVVSRTIRVAVVVRV